MRTTCKSFQDCAKPDTVGGTERREVKAVKRQQKTRAMDPSEGLHAATRPSLYNVQLRELPGFFQVDTFSHKTVH